MWPPRVEGITEALAGTSAVRISGRFWSLRFLSLWYLGPE